MGGSSSPPPAHRGSDDHKKKKKHKKEKSRDRDREETKEERRQRKRERRERREHREVDTSERRERSRDRTPPPSRDRDRDREKHGSSADRSRPTKATTDDQDLKQQLQAAARAAVTSMGLGNKQGATAVTPASSTASVEEKRKLLWGRKKTATVAAAQPKPEQSSGLPNASSSHWQAANFESEERRQKFLKLMGAGKAGASSKSSVSSAPAPARKTMGGDTVLSALEREYEAARQRRYGGGHTKGAGLGFNN